MIVSYNGGKPSQSFMALPFDRGVPTFVPDIVQIPDGLGIERWEPGQPAAPGRRIVVRTSKDATRVVLTMAMVRALRLVFPTCPIVVSGSAWAGVCVDLVPNVSASVGDIGKDAYRVFDLRESAITYWDHPIHLKVRSAPGIFLPSLTLPLPGPFDRPVADGPLVLIRAAVDGWPDLVTALRRRVPDMVEIVESTPGDAMPIRDARAVIAIGYADILWPLKALGVPARVLLPFATSEMFRTQLTLEADDTRSTRLDFGWLDEARQNDADVVAAGLLASLGIEDGNAADRGRVPREDRRPRRGFDRKQPEDAEREPDAPRDTSGLDHDS